MNEQHRSGVFGAALTEGQIAQKSAPAGLSNKAGVPSMDQVYTAAVAVIQNNGVVLTEYIPHDTTNSVRSLSGKVNQRNVWVRVESIDPRITQVTVQARSTWGVSDVALSSELVTEVALQLSR